MIIVGEAVVNGRCLHLSGQEGFNDGHKGITQAGEHRSANNKWLDDDDDQSLTVLIPW